VTDERLSPRVTAAHDQAVERGDDGYMDPETGLFVMTRLYLERRGYCCDNGCRHCPYPAEPWTNDRDRG